MEIGECTKYRQGCIWEKTWNGFPNEGIQSESDFPKFPGVSQEGAWCKGGSRYVVIEKFQSFHVNFLSSQDSQIPQFPIRAILNAGVSGKRISDIVKIWDS